MELIIITLGTLLITLSNRGDYISFPQMFFGLIVTILGIILFVLKVKKNGKSKK